MTDVDIVADTAFDLVSRQIEGGRIPGAVLGIVDSAGRRAVRFGGMAQRVPTQRPVQEDTWFDLASLTKVIYTTPRILELLLDQDIDPDEPLIRLLPDLRQYDAGAWERQVTFAQCLSHQSPFPAVEPIYTYHRDAELLRAFVLQRKWEWQAEPVYSDINFILLGIALERFHGKRLWNMPAGDGFAFSAAPDMSAATEHCTWRNRLICGEVHDDNCSALQGAGHAGLFGTVAAVLDHAQALLQGSRPSAPIIDMMRQAMSRTRTLGWERAHPGWSGGDRCTDQCIGHTGFTGTGLWVDFGSGLAWTLLTNRIHPTRHADSGIVTLRRNVSDVINSGRSGG